MKTRNHFVIQLIGLLIIATSIPFLWRFEMKIRWGWEGLEWANTFHCSIMILAILFSSWLYFFIPFQTQEKRLIRSFIVIVGAVFAYEACKFGAGYFYAFTLFPGIAYITIIGCLGFLFLVIPLAICAVAQHYSIGFHRYCWLLVPVSFAFSFYSTHLFLELTNSRGDSDSIHCIKTGVVFFGLIISSGLPFIIQRKAVL